MSRSRWSHAICDRCWEHFRRNEKLDTDPCRLRAAPNSEAFKSEACCWCKKPTNGIYVRHDPAFVACCGNHSGDANKPSNQGE